MMRVRVAGLPHVWHSNEDHQAVALDSLCALLDGSGVANAKDTFTQLTLPSASVS